MATFQFTVSELTYNPHAFDNMQRRQLSYGMAKVQPDTPGGSTSTYVQGGIRAAFVPLEPIKATVFIPAWMEMQSASGGGPYLWVPGAVITSVTVASNVLTVTAQNNFKPGDQVKLSGLTGAASVFNVGGGTATGIVRVVTATAANFTAQVGVPTVAATAQTNAFATPVSYAQPAAGPNSPPMGSVKIFSEGAELAAGAIPTSVTGDTIRYRAEFVRSYF